MNAITDSDLPTYPDIANLDERTVDVPGGAVWARRIQTHASGTPLILLHGGPGFPSYYLEPLGAHAAHRPVIFYDQLGCGRSARPDDDNLWEIDRFVTELEAVLDAFGYTRYHIYGHSWGSMLATRYVTRYGVKRVASIIMSSPALQVDWWERDCADLIATLDDDHQAAIALANQTADYDSVCYSAAMTTFYDRYVTKRGAQTSFYRRTIEGAGLAVYRKMQGPNEFTITGTMKGWDFRRELAELHTATLFLTGSDDEARPNTVAAFASVTPGSRMVVIPDAAHLTMLDNAPCSNSEIATFLGAVDVRIGVSETAPAPLERT